MRKSPGRLERSPLCDGRSGVWAVNHALMLHDKRNFYTQVIRWREPLALPAFFLLP